MNVFIFLFLSITTVQAPAQNLPELSVKLGDPAPSLKVSGWLKGTPIKSFEKGRVYVVEFWATWCKPCIAAMPHLSALARKYSDRATFIGVDIYEKPGIPLKKIKSFVDSLGKRMDYHVAKEDSNFMATDWMVATGTQGIPATFIINAEGKLAWIGQPMHLDSILPQIINNKWSIIELLTKNNLKRYLKALDDSFNYELMKYSGDWRKADYCGMPDSALASINEIVANEPLLKYAPFISSNTFSALLKTDPMKAVEYGKIVIVTSVYTEPPVSLIFSRIESYKDKLDLPPEIYQLGAAAYQIEIDNVVYPELVSMHKYYNNMAAMYCCANMKSDAINAQEKAIEWLHKTADLSETNVRLYKIILEEYKKM